MESRRQDLLFKGLDKEGFRRTHNERISYWMNLLNDYIKDGFGRTHNG